MATNKVSRTSARSAKGRSKTRITSKSKPRSVGMAKSNTKERSVAGTVIASTGISEKLNFNFLQPDEHFFVANISCFSLRNSNGNVRRLEVEEVVGFTCSLCKRQKKLGKSSELFTRITYFLGAVQNDLIVCDRCGDVLCDLARTGPQVMTASWQIRSRIHKVSAVNEKLMCYSCLSVWGTHVVFKFGDHRTPGFDGMRRLCARCLITYLEMIRQEKKFDSHKKPYECARKIPNGYN